jgi:hypothetical protein
MTYTPAMRQAFQEVSSYCPKGFSLQVIDNEHFITLKAKEKDFMTLFDDGKRQAVEYMVRAKQALEANGAIVLLVREGGEEIV